MIIKYNAWDKEDKRMLSWDEIWEKNLVRDIFVYDGRYIPLQFSGESDVDGKEVYEGDNYINPLYPEDVYTVFKFKGAFTGGKNIHDSSPLCWQPEETDDGYGEDLVYANLDWLKKVGNIYEGLKIDL